MRAKGEQQRKDVSLSAFFNGDKQHFPAHVLVILIALVVLLVDT